MKTFDTNAQSAIQHSSSHNEIVTIMVSSEVEQEAVVEALRDAAGDLDTDTADNGSVTEVWAFDPESDDDSTEWRVHVEIGE